MDTTRRSVLGAVATLATVGAGASQVIAQESPPIEVTQVASEEEYVVFENTEMDDVDVSGYVVAFEYGNSGTDQRRKLPDGTVIGGGQSLILATGAKEVPIADVKLDYEGEVLNNDGTDVVALLTPDESTVIAKSDETSDSTTTTTTGGEGSDDGGEESDGDDDGTTSTETEDQSDDTNEESTDDNESSDDSESSDSGSSNGTSGEESGSEDESNDSKSSDDDSEEDC